MRISRYSVIAGCLAAHAAFAAPKEAEMGLIAVPVKQGYYELENCLSEADPATTNDCMCKAEIIKAEVKGLPRAVMTTINNQLSQVPEQLANESCAGTPARAPAPDISTNLTSANFETVYRSPTVLSVLVTYLTAGAGAAHPVPGSEGYSFDLTTGKTIDLFTLLSAEQLTKANDYLHKELLKQHGDSMLDEARNRVDPYLSDSGCESCTVYYTKDGWNVRFAVYAVAPYAVGEPTITIPTSILPEPETLIARKK